MSQRTRRMKGTAVLGTLLFFAIPAIAGAAVPTASGCGVDLPSGNVTVVVTSGGRSREFQIFLPSAYDGQSALPLVFDLHGSNGSGKDQAVNSNFVATAERQGFVVAWPNGGVTLDENPAAHYWNIPGLPLTGNRAVPEDAPDDVQFFADALDHLAARYCIDLQRVYSAGHSGGGRMSSLLGCRLANRIAAIAPVVGLRAGVPSAKDPAQPDLASCRPARAVPVITFHGTSDETNPYSGGGNRYWQYGIETAVQRWVELNGCSKEPAIQKLTERVERRSYTGCRDGAEVEFNRIDAPAALGGGHTWPGSPRRREPPPGATPSYPSRELDASERIWEFFSKHSL